MKTSQDPLRTAEVQPLLQAPDKIQSNHQNPSVTEATGQHPGSSSIADINDGQFCHKDIGFVQNLIEHCLQQYMNKREVVRALSIQARIEPGFTALVWQKLEEENSEFFRAYYTRLKLKKQIILFNQLLEHQYHLMKYPIPPKVPLAPMQSGIYPVHVNNLHMGYPVLQPPIPATGHLHVDPTGFGLSSCHVDNGIPASNTPPISMNIQNESIVMNRGASEAAPSVPQCSPMASMSEMAVNPTSAASNNHFPFTSSEVSIGMDASRLDMTFTSDIVSTGGLQLGVDGGIVSSRDSIRSLGELWNFSLSDLTTESTNLEDLGDLGDYIGYPFLPSDADILLDSPDQDNIVEEYFADPITEPCMQLDGDKSSDRSEAPK